LSDVLLLHGQPGGARDWDRVVAALGPRAQTIAIDRPGWDATSRPSGLDGNADAALAALDAHGVSRAIVVGHSLGGAVAAWLAARDADRVAALVLAAPAANVTSLDRLDRLLALPVAGDVASAAVLSGIGVALAIPALRRRIAAELQLDDRYLSASAPKLLAPRAWRSFVAEQRVLVRELPELERRLAAIAAPTTIVCGTEDRVVTAAAARALQTQIRGAHLVMLRGAGHLLPQGHAGELAEVIATAEVDVSGPIP
jgi:pimeloyl-ACP methyl ester carboxylesterase